MESCSRSPETQNGRKPVGTTACPFLEPDSRVFPNSFGLLSFACLPLEPSIPKDQWQGIREKKIRQRELTTVAFSFAEMFSMEVPQHAPLPSSHSPIQVLGLRLKYVFPKKAWCKEMTST